MKWVRLFERAAAFALRSWLFLGVLLRVTRMRDVWPGWPSVVFYSTPWPVIASGFALLALHFWWSGQRRTMVRYGLFAGAAVFTWAATNWVWTPSRQVQPCDLRVVRWNVALGEARMPRIVKWLRRQDADIIALAEADSDKQPMVDRWRAAFPDYRVDALGGEMVSLIRGKVLNEDEGTLAPRSFYGARRLSVRGHVMSLIQVDLYAGAYQSRGPALTRLADLTRARRGAPLIVLGDFNTPHDSAHLNEMRKLVKHAFKKAGRGFIETWPIPLPVHNLDQIWFGPELLPVRCETAWTTLSDHKPVIAEFTFAPKSPVALR